MKRKKQRPQPMKSAAIPFIDPPAKREPLRAPLGSRLLGSKSAASGAAIVSGRGAVVG